MNYIIAFLFSILCLTTFGQTKIISGKIINSDFPVNNNLESLEFWSASGAIIIGNDSINLGVADNNGTFKLEIPKNIEKLTVAWIGMYPEKIQLTDTCEYLEIILLPDAIYDFVSAKKAEKLRKKDREVLGELYYEAYKRGIFKQKMPCR